MRNEHVITLEQTCSSIQLVTGLGFDIQTEDQYTIACPFCHNRLFLLGYGFLCENEACDFRAGGILEFLHEYENHENYVETLDRLSNVYPKQFKGRIFVPDYATKQVVNQRLKARRGLFNLLRSLAVERPDGHHASTTRSRLARSLNDGSLERAPYTVFPMGKEWFEKFSKILTEYGAPGAPNFTDKDYPVLVPYMTNHHTIGALGYVNLAGRRPMQLIPLEPMKFQFSGLMQAHPTTTEVYLTHQFLRAASENGVLAQKDSSKLALTCLQKGSESMVDWLPAKATYLRESKNNNWPPILNLSLATDVMIADSTQVIEQARPMDEFLTDQLVTGIVHEGFTPEVLLMLEWADLHDTVVPAVVSALMSSSKLEELQQLNTFLRSKTLMIEGRGEKLTQTEEGYFYNKDSNDYSLTNFLIDFHRVIRFHNSKEVYYEVDLIFSGNTIRMIIPHQAILRPTTLEETVKQFPTAGLDTSQIRNTPALHFHTGPRIGMLLRFWKKLTGTLPVVEGINTLGWAYDRKRYDGPNWIATADGIRYQPLVFSPGSELLKLYVSREDTIRKVHAQLPLDMTHMIAQAIGLVFRSYCNVPLMAIPILREGEGEKFVRGMFRELGQNGPLHYNESQWLRGADVSGYPMYGTGCDYRKTKNIKQAVFMLTTDRGQRIESEYDPALFEKAGQTFRQVFHECIEWMLAEQDTSFETHRSVDPNCILAKEGARVIERAMGIEWHIQTPAYNALDTLLSNIPFDKTHEYMTLDLNKRTFELKLEGLPKVDPTDLQLELSQYANGVVLTEHGVAANDSDMKSLVTTYYQDVPKLEELFVPPSDT